MSLMTKIFVLGSGAREKMVCKKLSKDLLSRIDVPLSQQEVSLKEPDVFQIHNITVEKNNIPTFVKGLSPFDLVIVGSETYLQTNIVELCQSKNVKIFAPSYSASKIELSKLFGKQVMAWCGISTPEYRVFSLPNNLRQVLDYISKVEYDIVIKYDGLMKGKGVFVPESKEDAQNILIKCSYNNPGKYLIEKRVYGQEYSAMAFCDGKSYKMTPIVKDYKKRYNNDQGKNTGGMGAYHKPGMLSKEVEEWIGENIFQKVLNYFNVMSTPYVGVLYAGLIISPENNMDLKNAGIRVLEFNCRLGDPETQVVLPLMKSSLYQVILKCVEGILLNADIEYRNEACVVVNCVSKGYCEDGGQMHFGFPIKNLNQVPNHVLGGAIHNGSITETSGGRVLSVYSVHRNFEQAREKVYKDMEKIDFYGKRYRTDIGLQTKPLRIAVIGSTNGTNLPTLIDYCHKGEVYANIEVVITNKMSAGIYKKAKERRVNCYCCDTEKSMHEILIKNNIELIILNGYMKILSP